MIKIDFFDKIHDIVASPFSNNSSRELQVK